MQIKKLWRIFISLLIFYLGLEFVINKICAGHHLVYNVKDGKQKIVIEETYKKINHNRYDFVFTVNKVKFYQSFFKNLNNRNYMVNQVEYISDDNYQCIYPIYKDKKIKSNLICYDGKYYYPYSSIVGKSDVIDKFMDKYQVEPSENKTQGITVYYNNLIPKHKLFLENYKGIYTINDDGQVSNTTLFTKDVYTKNISGFTDDYYFVANYENEYATNQLIYLSLNNMKQKVLKKKEAISFDSFVEGVIDNEIYLLDKSNKQQYKINLSSEKIELIGDENKKLSIYINGKWQKQNYYLVEQDSHYFSPYEVTNTIDGIEYEKVDHIKNRKYDFYYMYKKDKNGYHMFRKDKSNNQITSLFDVDNINQIYYQDNGFYFKHNDTIYYYDDMVGLNKIITYSELKYNKSLLFYVTF